MVGWLHWLAGLVDWLIGSYGMVSWIHPNCHYPATLHTAHNARCNRPPSRLLPAAPARTAASARAPLSLPPPANAPSPCSPQACAESPQAVVTGVRGQQRSRQAPAPLNTLEMQKRATQHLRLPGTGGGVRARGVGGKVRGVDGSSLLQGVGRGGGCVPAPSISTSMRYARMHSPGVNSTCKQVFLVWLFGNVHNTRNLHVPCRAMPRRAVPSRIVL